MTAANVLAIAIPTLAILFGILLNRQDATAIRSEMRSEIGQLRVELRTELRSEIGSLRSEMIQLRKDMNGDMVQLRNSVHADMVGIHERIATVEAKQA